MCKTMLQLKIEAEIEDTVIRYKDFVIKAEFLVGPCGGYFTAHICADKPHTFLFQFFDRICDICNLCNRCVVQSTGRSSCNCGC
mgnify:CR=1 FL=1